MKSPAFLRRTARMAAVATAFTLVSACAGTKAPTTSANGPLDPGKDAAASGEDDSGAGQPWNQPDAGPGLGDDQTCGSVVVDSDAKVIEQPGNVLVIFDRSLTMGGDFNTPAGPKPRYVAAGDALLAAVTPIADKLTLGAILYPSVNGTLFCTAQVDAISSSQNIDFLPGAQFVSAWQSYWQSHGLNFGTWINRAFERAEEALTTSTLEGATAVVFFSDGEPVCQDGMPAKDRAAAWKARGIPTYVVGLPGALGGSYLTEIAQAGGQNDFIAPADSTALEAELEKIAQSTVRRGIDDCTLKLNPAPEDPALVHLVVEEAATGKRFEVARERAPGDGWNVSTSGDAATLTGALCADAKSGRFKTITFEFGCVELPIW
jgi:hypothetical protein